jgi:Tol biopolymer transport system component
MIGTTLGHYRIVRSLGRGGMGEVFAAEDTKLNRVVALKILPPSGADSEQLKRFQREAQAVAALNHPNVVTIYSVEESGGVPFLTMELVDGQPLDARLPRGGLDAARVVELAVPLADAVGAAHERGVVHRDLKPSNILVGRDGRLKVLDFGLAKLKAEPAGVAETSAATVERLTGEHVVLGTAAYMSPEQAEGRPVDQRTDIFSLGILLYELATGRRPFTGDTSMSVLSSIIKDTPKTAAEVNPKIPADLDRIIRRCLAKDPARRYQSAIDLRNDLEELAHSTQSRRGVLIGRGAIAAVSLAGIVLLALAVVMLRGRSNRAQPSTFTRLTSMPGREWFPSLSPDGKWVVYGAETEGNFDVFLQSTTSGANPVNLTKDSADDDDMPAFSPDGERIAFRSSRDGGGIFVMGRTGEAVKRLTRVGFNPAWSPDGRQIVFASIRMDINPQNSEGESELWVVNASGGDPVRLFEGDAIQPSVSPHNKRIAFGKRGGTAPRRTDIWTIPVGGGPATPVTNDDPIDWNPIWAPDGRHIYYVSDRSGTMNLWRIAIDEDSGKPLGEPEAIVAPTASFAHPTISADGRVIAYSDVQRTTNIQRIAFDPRAGAPVGDPSWITTGSRVWADPDPSPDARLIAYYSRLDPEGHLYISRADGTGQRQLTGEAFIDRLPHWSPDGAWISFFSNRSRRLQLWRIRPDGSDLQQMTDGVKEAAYSAWSPDSRRLAFRSGVSDQGSEAYIMDATRPLNAQQPDTLPRVPDSRFAFTPNSWSPDGARIAGFTGPTSPSAGIVLFSLKSRTYERVTTFGEWPVWLPDSRRILFGDGGKHFWVLDTATRETRSIFSAGRDVLGPPRITPDGRVAVYSRRITESDVHLMTLR